ncbi:hypothetical protein OROMI_028691 [Orobanche minor]
MLDSLPLKTDDYFRYADSSNAIGTAISQVGLPSKAM